MGDPMPESTVLRPMPESTLSPSQGLRIWPLETEDEKRVGGRGVERVSAWRKMLDKKDRIRHELRP